MWKQFSSIIGVSAEEAKAKETIKGNSHGQSSTYIKKILDQHIQDGRLEVALPTLALGIYVLVLLLGPLEIVRQNVVELFWAIKK